VCIEVSDAVLVVGDSLVHWAGRWYSAHPELRSTWPRLEFLAGRGATPRSLKLLLAKGWPKRQPPRHAVVHIGSNNVGRLSALRQREEIASLWEFLPCLSETTEFIWSDILPRSCLQQPGDWPPEQLRRVDLVRQQVNRFARRLCLRQRGRFIKHPSLQVCDQLFRPDGIHLSDAGQECFVLDLLRGPLPFVPGRVDLLA